MLEFRAFPKIPRLNRGVTVTEKIDGTNGAVGIVFEDGIYTVYAQSRNRLITPEDDNAGFARWVQENEGALIDTLGVGLHFGEWWGAGIQRRYGMTEKRFSLFNTARWQPEMVRGVVPQLDVVPVLYQGDWQNLDVDEILREMSVYGSYATPVGFGDPEGIVVYHHASNSMYKVTLKNDEKPKALVNA